MNRETLRKYCEAKCKRYESTPDRTVYTGHKFVLDLLKQTEWIPVSERLPEDFGNDYLVNIEYKGDYEGIDIATYWMGGYIDGLWTTPNDWIEGPPELWHVTAWMPLPQPYKVESEEE